LNAVDTIAKELQIKRAVQSPFQSPIEGGLHADSVFGLQFYCSRVNCILTAPELQFAVGLHLKCSQPV
jgi:hypothetical protein